MQTWLYRLHRAEDALLLLLLAAMIALAGTQILLRNLFDTGFIWIDPALRVMVLWLGMIGATVATRDNKHIRIDLFYKLFERNTHRAIQSLIGQISAWTCLLIAWSGFTWIRFDYEDGVVAFAGIPAWMLEIVVPLSFGLIGLRYFCMSLVWAFIFIRKYNQPHESDS